MNKIFEYDVFKLAHALTLDLYRITASFPDAEKYNLTSQIRRSAYSMEPHGQSPWYLRHAQ